MRKLDHYNKQRVWHLMCSSIILFQRATLTPLIPRSNTSHNTTYKSHSKLHGCRGLLEKYNNLLMNKKHLHTQNSAQTDMCWCLAMLAHLTGNWWSTTMMSTLYFKGTNKINICQYDSSSLVKMVFNFLACRTNNIEIVSQDLEYTPITLTCFKKPPWLCVFKQH